MIRTIETYENNDLVGSQEYDDGISPLSFLTTYREQRILEGINVNGVFLKGDNDTAIRLQGAVVDAQIDPNYTVDWSVGGEKVTLSGAQVIGLHALGRAHIRKCFEAFFAVKDNLEQFTTTAEIEAAFETAYIGE